MKKLLAILLISAPAFAIFAQAPQKMSYQAVIRNSSGDLVTNHAIGMRISILQGSATGTAVYVETHTKTTNENGLATIEIGAGNLVSGVFAGISWGSGSYFLKTETDPSGGIAYSITGTSQLLSVPYALDARTSESVSDNSITSAKIVDATIANADLGSNSVTSAKIADATVAAADLAANSVTTEKINAGAVTGVKIAQAGATSGQALKWNGTTWAPAADATGGGGAGWTDDGTMIRLSTMTDSVQMGSVGRVGKFNVGGNIGLSLPSSIYFGSDATRISGIVGGDMRLVADDLSMLTTGDISFGRFDDESWIKFDNANKRVGIGTLAPTDRLHVVLGATSQGLSAVRGVATAAAGSAYGVYGQSAGYKGRAVMGEATGTNSIGVMGLAANTSSTGVWGEGSNQGVYGFSSSTAGKGVYGKVTSPAGYSGYFEGGKFYVKGSAQVTDTLFAKTVKVTNSPRVFYKNSSTGWPKDITTMESWGPLDSVVVVAPGPGSVLLNMTGCLNSSHDYNGNTWIYVGISAIRRSSNFEDVLSQTVWLLHENLVGGYYQVPCAVTAVATVASAGTYKYYIVGWFNEWDGDEDQVDFGSGAISALFIPKP